MNITLAMMSKKKNIKVLSEKNLDTAKQGCIVNTLSLKAKKKGKKSLLASYQDVFEIKSGGTVKFK